MLACEINAPPPEGETSLQRKVKEKLKKKLKKSPQEIDERHPACVSLYKHVTYCIHSEELHLEFFCVKN